MNCNLLAFLRCRLAVVPELGHPRMHGRLAAAEDAKWSHQNEMRILARNFLKEPKLPIGNGEIRPRVELAQPRLEQSIVEVMVGPEADKGAVECVRSGLASRGLEKVTVARAKAQ
jgi:hypothetical protein